MKHIAILALLFVPFAALSQMKSLVLEDKPIPKPTQIDTAVSNWDEAQAGFTSINKTSKDFYYWTNYSRINPKRFWDSVVQPIITAFPSLQSSYSESLKQDLYNQPKLPLFKLNAILLKTSQAHAQDIGLKQGKPGHTSTDGTTFTQRVEAAGIRNCAGENVSLGNVDPVLSLVLLYIDYGLPNLGHRKSLLNPNYTETGIGSSLYGNTGSQFIVQDFSCTQ